MTDLGTLPGGDFSHAIAINASGQIAGDSTTSSGSVHAFRHSGGVMSDLGTLPGLPDSYGLAINADGEVVGYAVDPEGGGDSSAAFVYRNGTMSNLNLMIPSGSGWVLYAATGINGSGQIVGLGSYNGESRAFLLTPQDASVPALGPLGACALALALLAAARRTLIASALRRAAPKGI
jgi:probable HAF family extracellular repeat protein